MTAKLLAELQRRSTSLTFSQALAKYRPDQERDDHGRFADEGGGGDTRAMVARTGRGRRKPALPPKPRRTPQQVADDKVLERLRRASRASDRRKHTSSASERTQMAINYARWLAHRAGIELRPEPKAWEKGGRPFVEWGTVWVDGKREQRPKSVHFPELPEESYETFKEPSNYHSLSPSGQRGARRNPKNFVTVVTQRSIPSRVISIPNWDHVPIVTRGNRADYDE
jgi:hypothetical protein